MALYPFLPTPVVIDPTSNPATLGWTTGLAGSGGLAPFCAPILYNGKLYMALTEQGPNNPQPSVVQIYQSSDKGNTWQVLDQAHSPACIQSSETAAIYFDGAHTIIVAFPPTSDKIAGTIGPINLQNFDLSAGTWGAVYGTVGAPNCYSVAQCFERPDGSILVLYSSTFSGGNLLGQRAAVYAAGAWSTFAVDTNVGGGYTAEGNQCAAVMDSTGRIHLFGTASNGSGIAHHEVYYQAINTDNSLGTFAVVLNPAQVAYSQPVISGNSVLVSLTDNTSQLLNLAVGSPLSAPSFSVASVNSVDTGAPALIFENNAGLAVDATGVYLAYFGYVGAISTNFTVRLLYNASASGFTSAANWTGVTAAVYPTFVVGTQGISISRQGGNTFGTIQGNMTLVGLNLATQYWLGVFNPSPAPLVNPSATGGAFWCCPNFKTTSRAISCAMRGIRGSDRKDAWPYVGLVPPGADPVHGSKDGIVVTAVPGVGATATLLSYVVPQGWRFFLAALLEDFEGAFTPGDTFWSAFSNMNNGRQINPIQGLVNVPVPLGAWRTGRLWYLRDPMEFAALDTVVLQAKNINLTGLNLYYVSGVFGWLVSSAER